MKTKKDFPAPVRRAALYIRMSTKEQALHGYSLEAQRESLTEYAKAHELAIVDYYVDEGKSARKKYTTRPQFMRMLGDVQAGKIDLILFIKLDRWFRNVGDYYEVQRILDKYAVTWQATQEDYESATTSGRLKINIMLSVAQDEADRTSDRIKFAFQAKLLKGEAITGRLPLGLMVKDKHVVHDPKTVEIARALFYHYAEHGSKHAAVEYIYRTYGMEIDRHAFCKMLHNTLYKGEFRGIAGYCEPVIPPELFDQLNSRPTIRANPQGRIFLFAGLMICGECGYHMNARYTASNAPGSRIYYRCNRYSNFKACTNSKLANEIAIEQWLLDNIEDKIQNVLIEYQAWETARKPPTPDRATIKRKLERLKELYINDMIDMNTYKADYEFYTGQLAAMEAPPDQTVNIQALRDFLDSNFKKTYATLDRENRRAVWRNIIKEIHVDSLKHITVSFA